MSTIPFTSGTCCWSMASIPWRKVTSAIPHPWHPPAIHRDEVAGDDELGDVGPRAREDRFSERGALRFFARGEPPYARGVHRHAHEELAARGVDRLGGDLELRGIHSAKYAVELKI